MGAAQLAARPLAGMHTVARHQSRLSGFEAAEKKASDDAGRAARATKRAADAEA